jgi:hypothetical protein
MCAVSRDRLIPFVREADPRYTSNITKKGAVVREMFLLLREWVPGEPFEAFADRVVGQNLLGKNTRWQINDALQRAFRRRLLTPDDTPARVLKTLSDADVGEHVLVPLLFYWTCVADRLLFDFAARFLKDLWDRGRLYVESQDALRFVEDLIHQGQVEGQWSPYLCIRTARGLLATTRDFGVLEGHHRKRLTSPQLPWESATVIAYDLRARGTPPPDILSTSVWHIFLLGQDDVRRILLTAEQEGYLKVQDAGSIVRMDWSYRDLQEVAHALAGRARSKS